MDRIELREAHASLMLEITAIGNAARHLMEAATGLGDDKLKLVRTELQYSAEHLTAIWKRLK
jgi:hypothetical protein